MEIVIPRTGVAILDIFLGSIAVLLVFRLFTRSPIPKGLRLPPGPPGKPIIGNVTDMPTDHEWKLFAQWAKQYGDVFHVKLLGQSIVVLNSIEVAYDLFEKRSSIYSDRCEFPMLNDLMGFDWNFALMRYGVYWRRHRRLFHQKFHPAATAEFHAVQTQQTRALLRNFYETPEQFVEHLRHTAGAIIMEIIYGIKVLPKDDPYIVTAEKAMKGFAIAGNAGAFLVDVLPILKYVPEWVPGAGFQKKARIWRESITAMSVVPFLAVKNALGAGTAAPSVVASLLEEISFKSDTPPGEEDIIRNTGSASYLAGSDTTVSALHTFMLGILVHPEVQRKAQEELDSVLGDRLPEFSDRESLPYINALCKEIIRWHPVVPRGVAHRVTQNDVYGDYFIPEGAIVLGNSWYLLHDERNFGPEPEKFKPERFLVPGVKDPNVAFGFGRRICPGRYMADNSVFIAVASILKVFNVTPAHDSHGKEIHVEPDFTSGFLSHPTPFQCSIMPRSDSAVTLLLRQADD